jgi:hypothetical protein
MRKYVTKVVKRGWQGVDCRGGERDVCDTRSSSLRLGFGEMANAEWVMCHRVFPDAAAELAKVISRQNSAREWE